MSTTSPAPEPGSIPVNDGLPAGWPPDIRAELARRRVEIDGAVAAMPSSQGRVLDLADPAARRIVLEAGAAGEHDGSATASTVDAVVSIAGLLFFADLALALRGIDRLLTDEGELWFVEPVARPGWAGLVSASAGSRLPAVRELHVGRDVPLAVRANGFLITDIKRFTMPTSVWPLRPFVHARAIRFPGVAA